ncbi:mitochondrial thiamine pyrophosphate carrier-like [Asterias rubens]|uniref:mitochondrial thiamine pyrophosphate carrier-like n=1 Tax=Asterias rubens TaxID=7604 RepID=UPI001455BB57|nr:mitochondrial thiamine pyrophosphate carrier-like [Asterias rubens]
MVGYKPHKESQLTPLDHGLAGAFSGAATRAIIQPLDVLKIRFQLQVEPLEGLSSKSKYTGISQAWRTIYREEGAYAFWKGHAPAQLLSVMFGIVQFTTFEYLTAAGHPFLSKDLTTGLGKPFFHFMCGGLAGSLSTVVCQPIDIVRTRFIAQGEPKLYNTSLEAVRLMYREAGVRTFFRGLVPTMIQVFPLAGFQFGFYALFKHVWEFFLPVHVDASVHETTAVKSFTCGAFSGICAKTVGYPLDLLKKRLQVQGFEEARKSFGKVRRYNSMLHCISCIVKEEGLGGLYKGLSPSTLKAFGTVGFMFCFYEKACHVLETRHS